MALIDGKQIRDASIAAAKLAGSVLAGLLKADGSIAWTAAQNAGSQRLSNLGAPTAPSDAARLQDLYQMPWKERCLVATTGNINLATIGLAAQDGITLTGGERVLVWKQTAAAENGIYIAGAGAWARAADADAANEIRGMQVRVEKGATYADHQFALTTDDITLGTTGLTFVDIGVGGNAAVASALNKGMTANVTTVDGQKATETVLAAEPASTGYVRVFVNGLGASVGDGVKTKDCYFSSDNGATAKAIANIALNDTCHWNGSVAGWQLAATDRIDFDYLV